MCAEVFHVDAAADQAGERWILLSVAVDIQALVGQVADARRKVEAEQRHEREEVIGEPSRVGVVLLNAQIGLVVQKAIEDMGGVAYRGINDLGVERRVLIGEWM